MIDYNEMLVNACIDNDFLSVKLAIKNNADINYRNQDSFKFAISNNNLQILKYLYKQITFKYINDEFLKHAIKFSSLEIVEFLINETFIFNFNNLFDVAIKSINPNKYDIVKLLLTKDIDKKHLTDALKITCYNINMNNISKLLIDNNISIVSTIIFDIIISNNIELLKYINIKSFEIIQNIPQSDDNYYFNIAVNIHQYNNDIKKYDYNDINIEIIAYLLCNNIGNINNIKDLTLKYKVANKLRRYKIKKIIL